MAGPEAALALARAHGSVSGNGPVPTGQDQGSATAAAEWGGKRLNELVIEVKRQLRTLGFEHNLIASREAFKAAVLKELNSLPASSRGRNERAVAAEIAGRLANGGKGPVRLRGGMRLDGLPEDDWSVPPAPGSEEYEFFRSLSETWDGAPDMQEGSLPAVPDDGTRAAEQWPATIEAAEHRVAARGLRLVIPTDGDGLMASLAEVLHALYPAWPRLSADGVRGLLAEALHADLILAPDLRALWPRVDNPAERWHSSLFPQDTSGFGDTHRLRIIDLMGREPFEAEPAIEIAVEVAVQNFPWGRVVLHGYGPDDLYWGAEEVVNESSPVLVRFHAGGFWAAAVPDADGLLAAWEQPEITAEDHAASRSFGPGLTAAEEADAVWSPRDVWTAAPAPAGPDPDGTRLPSGWEPGADTMDVDHPHRPDDEAQVVSAPPSGPVPSGSAPIRRRKRPAGAAPMVLEEFMSAAREYAKYGSLEGIAKEDAVDMGGKVIYLGGWLHRLENKNFNLPGEEVMLELLDMGWSPEGSDLFNEYIAELEKLRGTGERGVQDDRKEWRHVLVRLIALERGEANPLRTKSMTVEEFVALEAQVNEVLARIAKMKKQGVKIASLASAVSMERKTLEGLLSGERRMSINSMKRLANGNLRELETSQVAASEGRRRTPLTIDQKELAKKNWARVRDLHGAGVPPLKLASKLVMQVQTLRNYLRTGKELSSFALAVLSNPEVSGWLDVLEAERDGAAVGEAVPEGSGRSPSQGGEEESADTSGRSPSQGGEEESADTSGWQSVGGLVAERGLRVVRQPTASGDDFASALAVAAGLVDGTGAPLSAVTVWERLVAEMNDEASPVWWYLGDEARGEWMGRRPGSMEIPPPFLPLVASQVFGLSLNVLSVRSGAIQWEAPPDGLSDGRTAAVVWTVPDSWTAAVPNADALLSVRGVPKMMKQEREFLDREAPALDEAQRAAVIWARRHLGDVNVRILTEAFRLHFPHAFQPHTTLPKPGTLDVTVPDLRRAVTAVATGHATAASPPSGGAVRPVRDPDAPGPEEDDDGSKD
ncbi:hypothetical protein [Streptomyces sp. NPDC086010]|uniref:hypothetical protein n=1 Tax=Streptomyces sp. NPDC086010 TaxID=3365745 RepID=UPI0037D23827